jgi:transcriptional regulator GlxA family with amidase domain
VQPDYVFAEHPPIGVLLVPGGVVTAERRRPEVTAWIDSTARQATLAASVCTGAFLLAQAGLLDGRTATTHWEDIDDLRAMFPAVQVVGERRWVDQGPVVTSAGISAGIDMSLHLVERLAGRELALRTARQMDFDWREDSSTQ